MYGSRTTKGPGSMSFRESNVPLSRNEHLLRWVEKMAELAKPDAIHWVDGSEEEYEALCERMVHSGTLVKLNEKLWPGCYYARSAASPEYRAHPRPGDRPTPDS